jgi:predicted deacylase
MRHGTTGRRAGKQRGFLETGKYEQGVRAQLPLLTVRGAKPGPTGVIMAGQHGRELNGIAAIAEVFATLNPARMKGTVHFLPVMNPVGIRSHAQDYPTEKSRYRPIKFSLAMNMNNTWLGDGKKAPSYASAIEGTVWKTLLRHADFGVDLHGWTDLSLCLSWAHRKYRDYLRAFGLPWMLTYQKVEAGSSESITASHGIPWVVCELTPQNRINPESVAHGVRGIRNALRFHGLLDEPLEVPPVQYECATPLDETVIRTPVEGLLVGVRARGDWVRKGDTVLRVLSLETLKTVYAFEAPHDSLVFNIGGSHWGEDLPENFVVFPGQMVGLLHKPVRIHRAKVG